VVAALDVHPGDRVADLGPGYGHFTVRLARAVEPDGTVYALDADPSVVEDLRRIADERQLPTLRPVRIPRDRPEVPEPVDLLFVSATYHHLPEPEAYFRAARALLRDGGRVVILEARREGLLARWMRRHDSSPRQVRDEMGHAGFRLVGTRDVVRGYWFAVFEPA
jgi:cyclopropane fatty-acyl-phospholipid synthase-like methyltransferase